MKFITQDAMDNAVLFKLFVHAQSSDKRLKKDEISKLFQIPISAKRVDLALDNLSRREFISKFAIDSSCSIDNSGYRHVEEQLAQPNSFIRRYAEAGDEWLGTQTLGLAGVPASDRIVLRSDNQDAIEKIDQALDDISGELAKNNEVGAQLGDEKDVLQAEIEASKTLTNGKSFRIGRLISLLAPALKYLSDKFGGAAIGDAAKRLLQLLFDLI